MYMFALVDQCAAVRACAQIVDVYMCCVGDFLLRDF